MKLTQHGASLWQLTRLTAFNSYLVDEGDGLTVIDTNLSGSHKDIVSAAERIGKPITRITLTHAHADHAASLDALAAMMPDAEVAYSQRTADFLQGDMSLRTGEPAAKLRGSYVQATTEPSRLLDFGDRLGSLRIIAAPGHTPDQIAFYDERDGTLIAGDAFQTKAGIAVSGVMRWLFPFTARATWHLPTAVQTAVSLRALDPGRLAVGHGSILENPGKQMDKAIAEAEGRIHAQAQTA